MWWQCPFVGCCDFLTTPSVLGMVWLPSSSRTSSCVLRFESLPTKRENKLFPRFAPNSWKPPPSFPAWESRSSTKLLKIKLPNGCRHPCVHDLQDTCLPDKERTQNCASIYVHGSILASYQILPPYCSERRNFNHLNAGLPHAIFFANDVGCPTSKTPKIMSTVPVQIWAVWKKASSTSVTTQNSFPCSFRVRQAQNYVKTFYARQVCH